MIQVVLQNECDVKILSRELSSFMHSEGKPVVVIWGTEEVMKQYD